MSGGQLADHLRTQPGDDAIRIGEIWHGSYKHVRQTAGIFVHNEQSGTVEVHYLEERPEIDDASRSEGPFLKDERSLIDAIPRGL